MSALAVVLRLWGVEGQIDENISCFSYGRQLPGRTGSGTTTTTVHNHESRQCVAGRVVEPGDYGQQYGHSNGCGDRPRWHAACGGLGRGRDLRHLSTGTRRAE